MAKVIFLQDLINKYDLQQNVRLIGYVPFNKLAKLYAACQIFVLPTLAEATPAVVKEAMACGKPVIATKVGGIPLLIKDGQTGFLVDPADEKQIAEKIAYLIDEPTERERIGTLARKFIEEEFAWDKILKKFMQVYQS